jgi:2'-5' RNA ligase
MKVLVLALWAVLLYGTAQASAPEFKLHATIKAGASVPFLTFHGPGAFDNYLAMNLPYPPMQELFGELAAVSPRPLKTRGEAHITVITPVEYWNDLRPYGITISDIDQIAERLHIQSSQFNVLCLGRGSIRQGAQMEHTFYVVVQSKDLFVIRQQVQKLLLARGGRTSAFNPYGFHPHITLGFTSRDLFEADGVIKDVRSCVAGARLY